MNFPKNKNVQENAYDKLAILWVVRTQSTGFYNKSNKSSDVQYVG